MFPLFSKSLPQTYRLRSSIIPTWCLRGFSGMLLSQDLRDLFGYNGLFFFLFLFPPLDYQTASGSNHFRKPRERLRYTSYFFLTLGIQSPFLSFSFSLSPESRGTVFPPILPSWILMRGMFFYLYFLFGTKAREYVLFFSLRVMLCSVCIVQDRSPFSPSHSVQLCPYFSSFFCGCSFYFRLTFFLSPNKRCY